ncbi:HMG1/2-like protein isoform X2 [Carica papaya]|uniref:HMG1/2-like protein isoform X2 n=1 Tax=Carica papaya TaxID=3649 RepID=UPI000B8CFA0E|nr:HMG1/2-like protein isoform X2 [Carica papaya]
MLCLKFSSTPGQSTFLCHLAGIFLVSMKFTRGKRALKKDANEPSKPVEDKIVLKVGKRKAAIQASKSTEKLAKKIKSGDKDPNKPKRPPTAFFVFLEEFRKVYKEEHPNVKAVSAVGKAGGQKWKSMTQAEKAPYEAKAAKRKSEYVKLTTAYKKKQIVDDERDDEGDDNAENEEEEEDDDDDDDDDDEEDDD